MTNQLFTNPPRAFDRNGEPLASAKAYIYRTGTLTQVTVTDVFSTPLPWPVIADVNGTFPQMFYAGVYDLKLIITDSADVVQPGYPLDPVSMASATANAASEITFDPTAEAPSLDVQGAIEDISTEITTLKAITVTGGGMATGGGTLTANRVITVPIATTGQATGGTNNTAAMTPLRTAEAIAAAVPAPIFTASFVSTDQTITSAALLTLAHGLGAAPALIALQLVCQSADAGWSAGDIVHVGTNNTTGGATTFNSVYSTATNVLVRFSDSASCFNLANKATGGSAALDNTKWKLRVRAWK